MFKEIQLPQQLVDYFMEYARRFYEYIRSTLSSIQSIVVGAYGFKVTILLKKDEPDGTVITITEPVCEGV